MAMRHCELCGARAATGRAASVAACPEHGPLWRGYRNAPVAGCTIVRDGQVLLAQRAHEPLLGDWESPGGFVELGEHPGDAAVREVREELGLEVRLTGLLGIYVTPSLFDEGSFLQHTAFLAEADGDPRVIDPHEVSDWGWFSPDQAVERIAGAHHRRRIEDWVAGRATALPGGFPPARTPGVSTPAAGPFHCDECGAPAPPAPDQGLPRCAEHGPRWRFIRNAPVTAALVEREGRVLLTRRARAPASSNSASIRSTGPCGRWPRRSGSTCARPAWSA
jgi:8-oxo-dGTP diphosphatase